MAGLLNKIDDSGSEGSAQPPTRAQAEVPPGEEAPAVPVEEEAPAEGAAPVEESDTLDDEQPNVTPEEQAQYDQFVKNGFALIYTEDGEVRPSILALMDNDPSDVMKALPKEAAQDAAVEFGPVNALAATAVTIVLKLVESADSSGNKPEGDVIAHGGMAIIEDLAEIALGEKIQDFTEDEMAAAFVKATQLYFLAARERGLIDDEEALKQDFAEIQAADAAGPEALDQLLPGLGSAAAAAEQQQAAPAPAEGGMV